ncbi:MAG: DUF4265 domain-containing protein [Candidatus Methylomirabilaceae bacterium]
MGSNSVDQRLVEVVAHTLPDGRVVREALWVHDAPGGRFGLVKTPLVAQGMAVGDEIEVDPLDKTFRVVRRGGNLTIQLFMKPELSRDVFEQLAVGVRELGGGLDAHTASIAGFWVPVDAGFPAVERVFLDFVEGRSDTEWMFANVYADDGAPLNWW